MPLNNKIQEYSLETHILNTRSLENILENASVSLKALEVIKYFLETLILNTRPLGKILENANVALKVHEVFLKYTFMSLKIKFRKFFNPLQSPGESYRKRKFFGTFLLKINILCPEIFQIQIFCCGA